MLRNVILTVCCTAAILGSIGPQIANGKSASKSDGKIPAYITAAVADPGRPEEDKQRDADRKPAETLQFAGIKPGETVVEFIPAKGYFTRILSKVVGPKGHVYALRRPAGPTPRLIPRIRWPQRRRSRPSRRTRMSVLRLSRPPTSPSPGPLMSFSRLRTTTMSITYRTSTSPVSTRRSSMRSSPVAPISCWIMSPRQARALVIPRLCTGSIRQR